MADARFVVVERWLRIVVDAAAQVAGFSASASATEQSRCRAVCGRHKPCASKLSTPIPSIGPASVYMEMK